VAPVRAICASVALLADVHEFMHEEIQVTLAISR
jgi:hypothetical protein